MATIHQAKCSNCDYQIEYIPSGTNYRYPGVSGLCKFPQIASAWCNDCKRFVNIQKGINYTNIEETIQRKYQDLISNEKKIIKLNSHFKEISFLKQELRDLIIIESLLNHKSSTTSCVECNGTNLVYKDLSSHIWRCPKCNMGFLKPFSFEDNCLYRPGERFISPQFDVSTDIETVIDKILFCAIDIINNESLLALSSKNSALLDSLQKKTSLIDRITLIFVLLTRNKILNYSQKLFSNKLSDVLLDYNLIAKGSNLYLIHRFEEYFKYFNQELDIEAKTTTFLPCALIKTLRRPDTLPTSDISGIDPFESLYHWKIILETINAYFPIDLSKKEIS